MTKKDKGESRQTTHLNVQEPWFSKIKQGRKTIEGRLCSEKIASIRKGDFLTIGLSQTNSDNEKNNLVNLVRAIVKDVVKYPSFDKYLSQEGLKATLPGVQTIQEGVNIYRKFYPEDKEKKLGICAIHLLLI